MITPRDKKDIFLVTGASGFIGYHLALALKNLGFNVLALDSNLRGGNDSSIEYFKKKKIEFLNIDLCNQKEINLLDPYLNNIKGIYHLAAFNGTNNFYKKPYSVLKNSTLPLLNLIDKLISKNLKPKILYTGSSECYAFGIQKGFNSIPTKEETILALGNLNNPRWSYACGKLSGEYALFNAYQEYKLPFVIARIHNVYGPRMGLNHFFSDFIYRCLNGEFYLYAPYQTRSYCFINDCIKALLILMDSNNSNLNVFNVGSLKESRNIDCANFILDQLNIQKKLQYRDPPEGSINRRKPDLTKLLNKFPSLANQTSLEDGLKATINWYKVGNKDFDENEN